MDSNSTPATLLMRLRQPGDQIAWGRFVQLYTPLLYHWANRWGLQNQDAADLLQEVFVKLVQKLPQFEYDREMSFRGWLKTIAHNKFMDFCRRRGVRATEEGSMGSIVAPHETDEMAAAEYRQHLVSRALELMKTEFPEKMWKACWEHVVEGRSAAEVAKQLGISEGTVYVAKSRIMFRLRQELQGLLE